MYFVDVMHKLKYGWIPGRERILPGNNYVVAAIDAACFGFMIVFIIFV